MTRHRSAAAGLGPNFGGSPMRAQARRGNGRWTRNPSLGCEVCEACRHFVLPLPEGGFPVACGHCGAPLCFERCTHGGCEEPFPSLAELRRAEREECGAPAIATRLEGRAPRCAAHLPEGE